MLSWVLLGVEMPAELIPNSASETHSVMFSFWAFPELVMSIYIYLTLSLHSPLCSCAYAMFQSECRKIAECGVCHRIQQF